MSKKLLSRFLVTTLSLASSVCVVGGVKASATQGRFESTDRMIGFLVDSGSGFVNKDGSDAPSVKLQKLSGGSAPSNDRLTLHDEVYANASDRIKKLVLKNSSSGSPRMISKSSDTVNSKINAINQLRQEFYQMIIEILLEILKLVIK